jgi:hypothetical protein
MCLLRSLCFLCPLCFLHLRKSCHACFVCSSNEIDSRVNAPVDIHPVNKAQLLSYMKLLHTPLGLIVDFNEAKLTDGVSRLILPGAKLD